MKTLDIKWISVSEAIALIMRCHYSKVMPRITKACVGGFHENQLVGVCTLGYGVRPLHTIQKIFPTLWVSDYFEIGKLCVDDKMPRNTESYFISRVVRLIQESYPNIKILFSWADGIIGKPGYVYQASNFYYGGYIWTEMYLNSDGIRVHPRTIQGLSTGEKVGKFKTRCYSVTASMGFTKYFGLQFRYVYPLCSKKEWNILSQSSPFLWIRNQYPKDKDCKWKIQTEKGKRNACSMQPFQSTQYIKQNNQLSLFK